MFRGLQRPMGRAIGNMWTTQRVRRVGESVANVESVARDHLANERTFLAWARTGLGILGFGTAIFAAYAGGPQYAVHEAHVLEEEVEGGGRGVGGGRMVERDMGEARAIFPAAVILWANGATILGVSIKRYFEQQAALRAGMFLLNKKPLIVVTITTALSTAAAFGIIVRTEFGRRSGAQISPPRSGA